nr:class I SAM-dependent methyltransferase [uncultured Desulfobacter sp.]
MRNIHFDKKFDATIAWHSFYHLPPEDQRQMFDVFAGHMNPGGFLLFTSGAEEGECWSNNNGEDLYHGSLGIEEYKRLLSAHKFHIVRHVQKDPECGGQRFGWHGINRMGI